MNGDALIVGCCIVVDDLEHFVLSGIRELGYTTLHADVLKHENAQPSLVAIAIAKKHHLQYLVISSEAHTLYRFTAKRPSWFSAAV